MQEAAQQQVDPTRLLSFFLQESLINVVSGSELAESEDVAEVQMLLHPSLLAAETRNHKQAELVSVHADDEEENDLHLEDDGLGLDLWQVSGSNLPR